VAGVLGVRACWSMAVCIEGGSDRGPHGAARGSECAEGMARSGNRSGPQDRERAWARRRRKSTPIDRPHRAEGGEESTDAGHR
jgi:hypothetical protein